MLLASAEEVCMAIPAISSFEGRLNIDRLQTQVTLQRILIHDDVVAGLSVILTIHSFLLMQAVPALSTTSLESICLLLSAKMIS